MTAHPAGEPTLAEVAAQFPRWECAQGTSGLYHGEHRATGQQVTGEDPLDLRDQIKAAEARHAWQTSADPQRRGMTAARTSPLPASDLPRG